MPILSGAITAQYTHNSSIAFEGPYFTVIPNDAKVPIQKYSKGFCLNPQCLGEPKQSWKIDANSKGAMMLSTSDRSLWDCPSCKHALYWSKKWRRIET